jgi:phage-related protein (TIGR01555 family)
MGGAANGTSANGTAGLDLAGIRQLALSGARADGFVQSETGLGDLSRDRSKAYHYDPETYDYGEMREEWRGDPLIAAFVEKPARAMFRRGFEVHTDSRELDDYIRRRLDELQITAPLRRAVEFSRAFRGGAVLLRFDDVDSPGRWAMPVRPGARLLRGEAYGERELWAMDPYWDHDPESPTFGEPTQWRWYSAMGRGATRWVHPSRLLILPGPIVDTQDRYARAGWGNSRAHRVLQATADYYASGRAILLSLQSNDQFAVGFKNFTQLLAREDGEELIRRYIRNLSRARSNAGVILFDADLEKPQRMSATMQGIADGMESAEKTLAAAYQMPLAEIFGTEPPGLNADGATNEERYRQSIGDGQRDLTPQILQVARFLVAEKDPGYRGTISVKWAPLREPSESEVEDVRLKVSQRDQMYIAAGVITPEEVRHSRFGGERYSAETRLDKDPSKPGVQLAAPTSSPDLPPESGVAVPRDMEAAA